MAAMGESASVPSPTALHSTYRYKAANPTPFLGAPDTLKPGILQVKTQLHLAAVNDPATQFLVATQFLAAGPLKWVQTIPGRATWAGLKSQMTRYYQPLYGELRARNALHVLQQRGTADEYSKAYNELVITVPQMTLEENLYAFIKGLKYYVQVSVSLQSPTIVEKTQLLAASADGILSNQRYYGGGPSQNTSRPILMEIGALGLHKNGLDPEEYKRRRAARLCFAYGKEGHRAYHNGSDGNFQAGN
jgi:Retrotransposon gag protein